MTARFCLRRAAAWCSLGALALPGGCISRPANPIEGGYSASVKSATGDYWYNQPASASIVGRDFDKLTRAAEAEALSRQFLIDRTDLREGVITTQPLVSRQVFEFWRADTTNLHDLTQSSLQTIRRTIRFEIARRLDGSWTLAPKVLVERYVLIGQPLTSPANMQYRVFTPTDTGGLDVDPNVVAPKNMYWYALGRDEGLEKDLAVSVAKRIGP